MTASATWKASANLALSRDIRELATLLAFMTTSHCPASTPLLMNLIPARLLAYDVEVVGLPGQLLVTQI